MDGGDVGAEGGGMGWDVSGSCNGFQVWLVCYSVLTSLLTFYMQDFAGMKWCLMYGTTFLSKH